VTETRRHALKILGTIGATCAFPFAGDELYGQHVAGPLAHATTQDPYKATFFTPGEYASVSRLADIIIPPTDTPGAAAAGVPEYIDRVVSLNAEHQPLVRSGLAWLERQAQSRQGRDLLSLDDEEWVAILQPLSDDLDRRAREALAARFRPDPQGRTVYYVAITDKTPPARPATAVPPGTAQADPELPLRFFRLIKNLTADGYYTSRAGLLQELGYTGNTALARFPECTVPEH
jgi:hypothetical protein